MASVTMRNVSSEFLSHNGGGVHCKYLLISALARPVLADVVPFAFGFGTLPLVSLVPALSLFSNSIAFFVGNIQPFTFFPSMVKLVLKLAPASLSISLIEKVLPMIAVALSLYCTNRTPEISIAVSGIGFTSGFAFSSGIDESNLVMTERRTLEKLSFRD